MRRIALRDREFERNMDVAYMEQLIADYERFMQAFQKQHPDIPIIKFDCDHLDFVHRAEDLTYTLGQIETKIRELRGK